MDIKSKVPSGPVSIEPNRLSGVLKEVREHYGLKQKELADRLGMTENYLSLLENGKRGISFPNLARLCQELDLQIVELMILAGENWRDEEIAANIEPVRSLIWARIDERALKLRSDARRQREAERRNQNHQDAAPHEILATDPSDKT